ncbi:glutamine--fructose-6-phosphate transaminase (isomerizing) [Candidatus Micrarchaeota archaeon]|nr:glutamine--fructose-6-phosphate transaminase (isomerizing) [Candidatus Micrarchaeota archaeon]
MCGIIGYVGSKRASDVITEGLKRLEYRGYDSVGIAIYNGGIHIRKEKGTVEEVSTALQFTNLDGHLGIGHTRWATHGAPCKDNAHPHHDCTGKVVLVHNGVIENFIPLKSELEKKGHRFNSETDTELIAHFIEQYMNDGLSPFISFIRTVERLKGSYSIVSLIEGEDKIYIARKNSPLILGVGKDEMFCASDIPAVLNHTKTFVPLEEGDIAVISKLDYTVYDHFGNQIKRTPIEINWSSEMAEKGGYPHFMLKEIHDQVHFIYESLAADVSASEDLLNLFDNIQLVAAGTSYHASLVLKYLLQKFKGKTVESIIASEYPFVSFPTKDTLVIAISQSGETADTIQAVRYAKQCGAKVLALTNVVQSSITRVADKIIYLNAGPEVSVAATKTFSSQLAVIYKMLFSGDKNIDLSQIPQIIETILQQEEFIRSVAAQISNKKNIFFLGRGLSYPIAMEGALKLKEISYIHAEAYPGGELKHGPLSLIENGVPVIVLAPDDETSSKMLGSLKEVKTRGAYVIAITNNPEIEKEAHISINIPHLNPILYPFVLTIPLQLLAYYVSIRKDIDPDRPRNLAKSVTVE